MSGAHHRIIYNHDGGTLLRPFHPFTGVPFSIEGFVDKTIGFLAGTHVDAVTWTLGTDNGYVAAQQGPGRAANLYCHKTDVGERFYELPAPFQSKIWHLHAHRVRTMIEQGYDPPEVVIEHGHRHGLDVFLGFRMNDLHDGRPVERNTPGIMGTDIPMRFPVFEAGAFNEANIRGYISRFKREHPEYLIGDHPELTRLCHIGFDYAHPPVRDFRVALIAEACQNYDLDGVELDFLRHPIYFKPGEEQRGAGLLTELVGRVRTCLDEAGAARNKRLRLNVRSLPLAASAALGIDLEAWLENGWIDGLIAGIDDIIQLPISDDAEKARSAGCPFYLSLKVEAAFQQLAYSREAFRAAAAYAYHEGADGIHLFNMNALRDSHDYGLGSDYDFAPLREIGDPDALRFSNKHYKIDNLGVSHRYIDSGAFHEWSESLQDRFLRSEMGTASARTELPARLEEGTAVVLHFCLSDDRDEAAAHGLTMTVVLTLRLRDLTGGDHMLALSLNGTHVHRTLLRDEYPLQYTVEVNLDPAVLTTRHNELQVRLDRGNPAVISELRLNDVEVSVKYVESYGAESRVSPPPP